MESGLCDEDGQPVKCPCGKKAVIISLCNDAYLARCKECAIKMFKECDYVEKDDYL